MLLAVKVGNTHVSFGLFEGDRLIEEVCALTKELSSPAQVLALLGNRLSSVIGICGASVVPSWNSILDETAREAGKTGPYWIDYTWAFAFQFGLDQPKQVGVDRLVATHAAVRAFGCPVIVVDSGTATTINAVSSDGEFMGGAISPGIAMTMRSMAEGTAQLYEVPLAPPPRAIGRTTEEALQSGAILGSAARIEGLVARFRIELEAPNTPVVVTGGGAPLLQRVSRELQRVDQDLILKGIADLYATVRT